MQCLLETDRTLFENWTHDAAILPSASYPQWKHYFKRAKNFEPHPGYRRYFAPVTAKEITKVMDRIRREGPLRPRDLGMRRAKWKDRVFPAPSLAKLTMEFLWRTGKLAVARREGQEKVYDLSQRVLPTKYHRQTVSKREHVDWACRESLKRLVAASPVQIAHFFDAVSKETAERWCQSNLGRGLIEVEVAYADGSCSGSLVALESMLSILPRLKRPSRQLRLINPFDPLIHDRQRTERVFGFDYTIEIWVTPRKRKYGYYVLPILEGQSFVGRVDAKVDRKQDRLLVLGLWWEPGIEAHKRRMEQLERELRYAGDPITT